MTLYIVQLSGLDHRFGPVQVGARHQALLEEVLRSFELCRGRLQFDLSPADIR